MDVQDHWMKVIQREILDGHLLRVGKPHHLQHQNRNLNRSQKNNDFD